MAKADRLISVAALWLCLLTIAPPLNTWPSIYGQSVQGQLSANSPNVIGGSGAILLAEAAYLDQVGQMTNLMAKFVDSLLEKVSFLAEVIIESSLMEQCETFNSCTASDKDSYKGQFDDWQARLIENKTFDDREFTNVELFREAFKIAAGNNGSGCKIFNLDIDSRDLPVSEMDVCCQNFGKCYSECGQAKHNCDTQFRDCLKSLCRLKYDFTNETLVRQQRHLDRRALYENEPLVEGVNLDYLDDIEETLEEETSRLYESEMGGGSTHYDAGSFREKRYSGGGGEEEEEGGGGGDSGATELDPNAVKRVKDKYKACKLASKMLIIGNLAFSCQAYRQSQWRVCCGDSNLGGTTVASGEHSEGSGSVNGNSNNNNNNANTMPSSASTGATIAQPQHGPN